MRHIVVHVRNMDFAGEFPQFSGIVAATLFLWYASLSSVSRRLSLALEAAALFLTDASLAFVSCGVSLALEVAALLLRDESLASSLLWCLTRPRVSSPVP
jgi:hypothetical protein